MKKNYILFFIIIVSVCFSISFKRSTDTGPYVSLYHQKLSDFNEKQVSLLNLIKQTDISTLAGIQLIKKQIGIARISLKGLDFWLRYVEPIAYKRINGPLPVEWETEVFEKFEDPYKREGSGLTLAALYLDKKNIKKDSLLNLIESSISATETYKADSVTGQLQKHHHFYLSNRLFLLNLAAIYTTGFECPDTLLIIPELKAMLINVSKIYYTFNQSFSSTPLSENYISLYNRAITFVNEQADEFTNFDHFTFIRDYINPLFKINQQLIDQYQVYTKSYIDYSLNNKSTSIFSKDLYYGQNVKGVFLRVTDQNVLNEIERIGKLLFYDPILSGNNRRSCNSCHKSATYFTDTTTGNSLQFDGKSRLPRNSPSLVNVVYNHLLMLDGKHISLQGQARDVIANPLELNSNEKDVIRKILNCNEYKKAFKSFLRYTAYEKEVNIEHIVSAITIYYSRFSKYQSFFDEAMNNKYQIEPAVKAGFNLFMSKAQCGTCHFVPQFNAVKPPYTGSEFEVLGVPADSGFNKLSDDNGRFRIYPAKETMNAFRTGSLRNIEFTKPYMHNGVFNTLEQVIDFYDTGGGAGKGLNVNNQTLSTDSLRLSDSEKKNLVLFLKSLSEKIKFDAAPVKLPESKDKKLNDRKIGGNY